VGHADDYILAFDRALRGAGFSDYNLLRVSSVLPPGALPSDEIPLPKGYLLPIAYGEKSSSERGALIGAAVAVAVPKDPENVGIIMEVTGNEPSSVLMDKAEALARQAMADRGIEVAAVYRTGADTTVGDGVSCVFAGVALWRDPS